MNIQEIEKLESMVIDYKMGESADNFEEMLDSIDEHNPYYQELVKTSEQETQDREMLFLEFRGWFCVRMEQDILSYLKGVI